ncbi:MAG: MoxR family ATPase, partial [Planctomycetota bacterium]
KVTIGNTTFKLPAPFLVIATQNPIEQSGTFELPEAQLDRFMLCHRLHYPSPEDEREILRRNTALGIRREDGGAVACSEFDVIDDEPIATTEDLISAMEATSQVYVSEVFVDHIVELVNRTRQHPMLEFGGSPRAGIALTKAARARALIFGRDHVIPEDMYALAEDVILHRIRLNYEALAEGMSGTDVLRDILSAMGTTPAVAKPR